MTKTRATAKKTAKKRAKKILTIERSRWRRGSHLQGSIYKFGPTRLLNDEGMMCCLGFDALACGVSPDAILNKRDPGSLVGRSDILLPSGYRRLRTRGAFVNSPTVIEALRINDSEDITDRTRERRLRPVLKRLGWDEVRFID